MTENRIKLAAALPKGDGLNGWNDSLLAERLIRTVVDGESVRPRVAVIVYDVKKVEVGDRGIDTAVVQLRRVQPVSAVENRRALETMLREEYIADHGEPVPFDLVALSRSAFGDLPRETDEIDRREEQERERMSPADELRQHLIRVHGVESASGYTDGEAEEKHRREHDGEIPAAFDHDAEWIGWTRADIEEATSDSDGDEPARDDVPATDGELTLEPDNDESGPGATGPAVPAATFSEPS